MSPWLALMIAGACEVVWALSLKQLAIQENNQRWLLVGVVVIAVIISISCLGVAMRTMSSAVAYGIWVAFGTIGTALFAWMLFQETLNLRQQFFLAVVLFGVWGLHGASADDNQDHESHRPRKP